MNTENIHKRRRGGMMEKSKKKDRKSKEIK